ncbi:MAG: uroporphyrinogen-III C-methyltransferase [Candidatus Eremiobacteraeota bacterium]|nr:uroporphyrinogen-III C-methyltransferase [Candidatus Eremiobacteraeota bacterium]
MKAADLIRRADVLLYDHLAAMPIVELAGGACERIYVGKQAERHALSQSEINDVLIEKARNSRCVVRLKGGDPFVFGRGGEEAEALREAGIEYEVVPGVTSAVAAPAYAGIPLTHREHNAAFTVVTGHEDPQKPAPTVDWKRLSDSRSTLVVMMGLANLESIVRKLRKTGLKDDAAVAVISDGTLPSQKTVTGTLATIVDEVRRASLTPPAVVVVGSVVKLRDQISWYDRLPLFGKRVLITRPAEMIDRFAAELYERGAQPILAPTIEIGPPDDPGAARDAVASVAENQWIVFTSQNGVRAFFDNVRAMERDARVLGTVKIAAIGPQTAETLATFGVRADLVPKRFISEEIARDLLAATKPNDRILLYRAQETRDVLADALRNADRIVMNVAAYKTSIRFDPALKAKVKEADILTFTSASTVSGFLNNLRGAASKDARGKLIACIGPVTAEAARGAGLHVDVVAEEYTIPGLLAALEGALQSIVSPSLR